MDERGDVGLDHLDLKLQVEDGDVTVGTESGVVDESVDLDAGFVEIGEDFFGRLGVREIGGDDLDTDTELGGETLGDFCELGTGAREENEIVGRGDGGSFGGGAAGGEEAGEFKADSGGGSGNENGGTGRGTGG